ncbi:MAG: hypothetical protein ONB46_11200 [candidate division KSB1 bacterium]|nr:hypothetical protein [candidate division KSB1 bacterium]MDZ7366346.1 hypothetical protein [candidate division KSB1 bacterium]MDZ7404001.1 hypothetical protein [candidate division KSB1 bacterium]
MKSDYVHYRKLGKELNHRVTQMVTRYELESAARSLGMLVRGVIVFDSEDEGGTLMDRAFYDLRRGNKNVIARFIGANPPESFSEDEKRLLEGMSKAWFSLFQVNAVNLHESSILLEDLIKPSQPLKLFDINLSQTLSVNLFFATRLIPIDDWHMTGGVGYPFLPHRVPELLAGLKQRKYGSKKRKYKIIPPEDYSAYFFHAFKRLGEGDISFQDI